MMPSDERPAVLLSFDAEEFDIPLEFGRSLSEDEQFRIGADGTERSLELLAEFGIRATFFTTGVLALRRPELIRRAVREGHEIASHALYHSRFEPAHLRESKDVLEQVAGVPVTGFRMPRMAPVDLAKLREAGYSYDSSVNPIWLPGRYNRFFESRRARVEDGFVRIPLSATPVIRWPLFWLAFKNQPRWLSRLTTSWVLRADRAAALYFHPWELMDNTGFSLPKAIARCSGESMMSRLREHLRWLSARTRFQTYAQFAEQLRRE
ncbi:MAG: polysaccharide deacetylase family protein [Planctomycetes bacterium]|nr:polysaccharide deacetylase family protein [Planctomycetota bacterium]